MIHAALADDHELVELVNITGRRVGISGKMAAHRAPGLRHRAFSVFLFDVEGRLLLQRHAADNYHSPGVWSNSCCGHPRPREAPLLAAGRRIAEELGVQPQALEEAGTLQ